MILYDNPVYLFGELDPDKAQQVVQGLVACTAPNVTLLINSIGGDVASGFCIVDVIEHLKSKGGQVRTVCLGEASSVAALVFASGTRGCRELGLTSRMMVHCPVVCLEENTSYSVEAITVEAKEAASTRDRMFDYLSSTSNTPVETWQTLLQQDLYLTPEQAIALGLGDKITC